jgi:acyl-CoA thioester hydrolase
MRFLPLRKASSPGYLECLEILSLNDQSKPGRTVPRLDDFPGHTTEIIRFGDLDAQGHVNNTVFATYFESGRVHLLRRSGKPLNPPGATSVLARLDINFLQELHWPGTAEIGTGVAEIGRSSYTFAQAIFRGGQCAATARATMVMIDETTRRSRPLPAEVLERLEELRIATRTARE